MHKVWLISVRWIVWYKEWTWEVLITSNDILFFFQNTTKCQVSTTSVYKQEHGLSSMRTTEYYSNIFPNYSFTNYAKTTPELSTTNSLNSKTTKNGFRTNQLPSFIWNNKNLDKSGISLPLYSFILMPTALAVLFLSLMCALWLCVYKRSKVCYCLTKEVEFFSVAFYVFRHNPLKWVIRYTFGIDIYNFNTLSVFITKP